MKGSLGTFFAKRYGYALLFAMPLVVFIVVLTVVLPRLRLNQEQQDLYSIGPAMLLFFLMVYIMFTRRTLRGILGAWQRLYRKIPTWSQYLAERNNQER